LSLGLLAEAVAETLTSDPTPCDGPGLEKNLVSISCLEDKGNRIAFVDGKVLSWHKDSSIENARVIRSREGNLYRLLEKNEEALVHDKVNPNELWHRRYNHINYQALPFLKRMVE
jgi:hypothetical protein